jgi:8-oxo-dGTP pyrophosphatase MutT (NUDIX family)
MKEEVVSPDRVKPVRVEHIKNLLQALQEAGVTINPYDNVPGAMAKRTRTDDAYAPKEASDVYVQSAVPEGTGDLVKKHGLLSSEAILKNPEVLKAFLRSRQGTPWEETEEQFRDRVQGRLKDELWGDSVRGPSVFFGDPDPDKITDKHPMRQLRTEALKINLSRLLKDQPGTRIVGTELQPYDPEGPEHQGHLRHKDITLEDVQRYAETDPKELWKHYNEPEGKRYASDVPHAQIVTPTGTISPEYLEMDKKADMDKALEGFRDGYLRKEARDPEKLPYRPTAEAFLRDPEGNLVAFIKSKKNKQQFLKVPGGGIDPGEDPTEGLSREIMEETGVTPKNVRLVQDVKWDWPEHWAQSDKQRKRYQQFRGEHSHVYTGDVDSVGAPTSQEGDAWDEVPSMDPQEAHDFTQNALDPKSEFYQGPEFSPYKQAQLQAILEVMKRRNMEKSAGKADAPNYRKATGERRCGNCAYYKKGFCTKYYFSCSPQNTCDSWESHAEHSSH